MNTIQGVLPVIQTAFDEDDRLDADTTAREIDWLFAHGADGIVMGMVSETIRLCDQERDELLRLMVRATAGRGSVVASVGAESSVQALRHAQAAEDAGVDAHMAVPPALTRCAPEEVKRYYATLVTRTTRPIIVQDASGYLGNAIPTPVQADLYREFGDRVMFKPEAQPIGPHLSALRDATGGRAAVFEGTGGLALVDSFRRGIRGTMPGADLIWAIVALWRALHAGDEGRIRLIQGPLVALISLQTTLDAFLAVEKFLLQQQGVFRNERVRGPVGYHLDPETRHEILRLFQQLRDACQS
jgi:dihydrodipicolinate synthase/N-acetylneuraminate lyase